MVGRTELFILKTSLMSRKRSRNRLLLAVRTRSSTESGGQTASIVGFRAAVFSVAMPAARPFSGAPC